MISKFFRSSRVAAGERGAMNGNRNAPRTNQDAVRLIRLRFITLPILPTQLDCREFYLLILRAMAMFIMAAHGVAFILVPLMDLLLSYLEIWPERSLGAVFGDPSRLWEYDPDNPGSSRRGR